MNITKTMTIAEYKAHLAGQSQTSNHKSVNSSLKAVLDRALKPDKTKTRQPDTNGKSCLVCLDTGIRRVELVNDWGVIIDYRPCEACKGKGG